MNFLQHKCTKEKTNNTCYVRVSQKAYSSLSNKHVGWNKTCRLENLAKFGNFETKIV